MKSICLGTYYQILNLLRVKKAVFFSFIFPAFIFLIFSFVWGSGNEVYTKFILTGVIVLTIASDAIFSIGTVVSGYYTNGQIKFLRVLPTNIFSHLLTLIFSRLILLYIAICFLLMIAIVIWKVNISPYDFGLISISIVIGTILFSLIGMLLAGASKENSQNSSLTNLIFYGLLFLSNCFYSLTNIHPKLVKVAYFNPFNIVLDLTRGGYDVSSIIISLAIWIVTLTLIVIYMYNSVQIRR